MSYNPNQGLFKFDFNDQHAILGVTVDCDATGIRNRYKELARLLHPDSASWETIAEKELAIKLFSNLVTHAYGQLSRTNQRQEQQMMLELMGKRLVLEASKIEFSSDAAKKLYQKNSADLYNTYYQLVKELASQQYLKLDRSIEITGQISELNMIYLLRKQNQNIQSGNLSSINPVPSQSFAPATPSQNRETVTENKVETKAETKAEIAKASLVNNSMRRAEEYINMRNWAKANIELREILKGEPNNVQAHAQLAIVYFRQNQSTMAKMHINKAIQLAPQDPLVKMAKKELEKLISDAPAKTVSDQSKGGMFGLFGKK